MADLDADLERKLFAMRALLDRQEAARLSPGATLSATAVRRRREDRCGHRQEFALDGDRILHSRAYTRYIDKTQVFYMVRNDHITHRVLHVQLVSKIARTIGRFLGLNEDLIEAIALGHDIGHPPFGHDGEKILDELCRAHGLAGFQHNIQSVIFLDRIEREGAGWNLSLQVLDGILTHDGESSGHRLRPDRDKDFVVLDSQMAKKEGEPKRDLRPMTLEGCVVRLADTVAYIGRDIEDAIELKLIRRNDIPAECRRVLGDSNGTIVYRLVADLIIGSNGEEIGFSPEIGEALSELKEFNYQRIYLDPRIKSGLDLIRQGYERLFASCLEGIDGDSPVARDLGADMPALYTRKIPAAAVVRDFIAGMTDEYFLARTGELGCRRPTVIERNFL